jgi:hypothetical protein
VGAVVVAARGKVLGLSLAQVLSRARYLASDECVAGYYRLNGDADDLPPYNGGKDPTAADPFDRWSKPGKTFVNITADCIGGASWAGGFDRYQPVRFAHVYKGWINTDSMLIDAKEHKRCFVTLDRPELGCFVVAPSGSPGHSVGHIGTIIGVPAEWDPDVRECWKLLRVVDVADRGAGVRANRETNALGWFAARKQGGFVKSIMAAD